MCLTRFGIFLALLLAAPTFADVKPHALFDHHMVLQRNATLPIWGTADPGEEIYVHLEVKTADGNREEAQSVKADKDGKWIAKLGAFPVGTDGVLTVRGQDRKPEPKEKKGPNAVVFRDVAIGEVWVCSGQSNMEWSLAACPKAGGVETINNSTNPMLRVFTVAKYAQPTPQSGFNPKPPTPKHHHWLPSQPDNAPMFSAVAYFFGKQLQESLKVPVGLIHTSWGGTPAQAWTSREALTADAGLKYYLEQLDERAKTYDPNKAAHQYQLTLAKWEKAVEEAKKNKLPIPRKPGEPQAPGYGQNDAASLYNGMIAPVLPFAIKGAIWYQGESNAGKPIEYRSLFAEMIQDWRKRWGHDFPFYCVQLAPFQAGNPNADNWAHLREAQSIACAKVKNAGVAVISDAGDLTDIHPQDKKPCGVRMGLLALAHTYGQKVEFSGPSYKAKKTDGNRLIVDFDHVAGGLKVGEFSFVGAESIGKDGKLVGFEVAGEDMKFHPATATIEGESVVLVSEAVGKPMHVRYGWKNFPIVNLFNKAGLPASPFRSDEVLPAGLK